MFGIIADLIASTTTILLPAYLAIKTIRGSRNNDPAQLTYWLIYFVMLALTLLFESWTLWIISWVPMYSWLRLIFLLYLMLPQTQGAKILFVEYVEPFILQHERQIDDFIGDMHNKLQSIGLGYLTKLVDILREKLLGQTAPQNVAGAQDTSAAGYAQNLLSRFAMPDARTNAASFYNMASGAAGLFANIPSVGSAQSHTRDVSSSAETNITLPSGTNVEKSNYIASERARLAAMLQSLEKEQQNIDLAYGSEITSKSTLPTSHSEASFESISHSDILSIPPSLVPGQKAPANRRSASGNWVTSWFSGEPSEEGSRPGTGRSVSGQGVGAGGKGWNAAKDMTDAISSSVDTGNSEMPDRRY